MAAWSTRFWTRAAAIQLQQSQSYIISNQNRLERIPLKNLLYIQHVEKNSLLVTDLPASENTGKSGGAEHTEFKVRKTLQEIYEELNPDDFLFIDRGFIVNLSHIMSVKAGCCILRDGTRLPGQPGEDARAERASAQLLETAHLTHESTDTA